MKAKAKIRKDLIAEGLLPAVQIVDQNGLWIDMTLPIEMLEVEFDYFQPDNWDYEEFNTTICDMETGRAFRISSIELDFIDEPNAYQIPVCYVETRKANLVIVAKTFDDACVLAEAHAAKLCWANFAPETKFIIANKE